MVTNEVLQGLLAKRAEFDERLIDRERRAIVDDIAALDRAARVFDPAYGMRTAARNRKPRGPAVTFARHELNRLIGQVLRNADGSMSTADVAAAVADRKDIPTDDKPRRSWLAVRVGVALNGLERSKAVMSVRSPSERNVRGRSA